MILIRSIIEIYSSKQNCLIAKINVSLDKFVPPVKIQWRSSS
jgi:hypothetical protein